ncbi:MAG: nicotinate (nicotinamide) nucleotide adenylyltransferase [Desulfuromonadaceae bacterium GWC2_58_13]|nr:MAG: nicotinate (nicotinamide) nucleotide adenylyltransferase [Desulfuromonadaceae bacterium GWC2_58_13]
MKIGILGGTFNPIHLAHLRIAEEVREACALDQIVFIPAAVPPHKTLGEDIPFAHRLAMVEAAIAENPYFAVSDIESRRTGKSYSVHTLEALHRERPDDELFFIIGMDSFRDLQSWKEYRRLFELCNIVVAARPGVVVDDPKRLLPVAIMKEFCYNCASKSLRHHSGTSLIFVEETFLDISSTHIRQLISEERSTRYLMPPAVYSYIESHGLYRDKERF